MMINNGETKILVIVMIIVILISLIIITVVLKNNDDEKFGNYKKLVNVGINLGYPSRGYLMIGEHITGLDNTSLKNITKNTFKLEIIVIDENNTYNITYSWNKIVFSDSNIKYLYEPNWSKIIIIDNPEINYNYLFIIRYLINSSDPDILNLTNMGENYTIHGSFSITKSWEINISIKEKYLNNVKIIDNNKIKIPMDQYVNINPGIKHWH